jgi:predicted regulator of Ras-like GTPase activity (Roadblock/LC7/MglB family)
MSTIRTSLRALIDVEGVIGSFVIGGDGGLVDTDLPATFDAAVFAEAGPRIVRLADLGASFGEDLRFLVIRFAEHKLYVRQLTGGFLGIVVSLNTSLPALKVAANLVARRVETMLVEQRPSAAFGSATQPASVPPRAPQISTTQTLPSAPAFAPQPPTSVLSSAVPPAPEAAPESGAPRRSIRFRGRSVD